MYYVIGGGGKVGEAAAKLLLLAGHEVAVIESDPTHADVLSEHLSGRVMVIGGECCDTKALLDAGIENADVYCALSGNDADNLASCEIATALYRVPRTVARVNDPRNERIFAKMGIEAVSSTTAIANMVQTAVVVTSGERSVMPLANDGYVMMEIRTASMAAGDVEEGRRVGEISLPSTAAILAWWTGERYAPATPSTLISPGMSVLVSALPEDEPAIRSALFDL